MGPAGNLHEAETVAVGGLNPRARLDGFLARLPAWALCRPRRALLLAIGLTGAAGCGVWRLELRTDGYALVPMNAPEVCYDRTIRRKFGIQDQIVVLIRSRHPDGVFNPTTVQLVRDLTSELGRLPAFGGSNILSLATELSFRFRPGTFINRRLLEPALTNQTELSQLREDVRQLEVYTGTLVSSDGGATAILLGVPEGTDVVRVYGQILAILDAHRDAVDETGVTGAPVAASLLGLQILEDLGLPRGWLDNSVWNNVKAADGKRARTWHWWPILAVRRLGLVPTAVLVIAAVFLMCFHRFMAVLLPLPGAAAAVVFTFGLMGWMGVPIYLTTAVTPVLLMVTSVTNDIYLLNRYLTWLRVEPSARPDQLLRVTFGQLAGPVVCTALTTGIGFFSFGLSSLAPVRAFGLFTGLGTLFGLLFSLTALPALLVLVPPGRLCAPRGQGGTPRPLLELLFARAGSIIVHRRWAFLGVTVALVALTPLGLRRLTVQDSWVNGFDPQSDFRRVTRGVNESFFGMHLLFVSVEAPLLVQGDRPVAAVAWPKLMLANHVVPDLTLVESSPAALWAEIESGPKADLDVPRSVELRGRAQTLKRAGDQTVIWFAPEEPETNFLRQLSAARRVHFEILGHSHFDPEVIGMLDELGNYIRNHRWLAVGGVLGPADYLKTARFMLRPEYPQARQLPASSSELKALWNYCGLALGQQRLRQVVNTNYSHSLMAVFLKDANFAATARLMREVKDYERQRLAPKGIKVGFAGDVAVSQALIRAIVRTQLESLTLALAGIFGVTALFGGSWRWGLYCLLPSLLAVIVKFAIMGWVGITVGVATSMFAAMTLGIGVNCAIHLLEGFQQARVAGAAQAEALQSALALTGPPALMNTLAMSLGFGVLTLSQVPANARLGLLLVLGLVNCFVASLVLLPVLLHWWPHSLQHQRIQKGLAEWRQGR